MYSRRWCCWPPPLLLLLLLLLGTPSAAETCDWLRAASMFASSVSSRRPMLRRITAWPWSSTSAGQMKARISSVACGKTQQSTAQHSKANKQRVTSKTWPSAFQIEKEFIENEFKFRATL
jgi:hypothetical protein